LHIFVCLTGLLIAVSTIDAAEEAKPPVGFEQGLKEVKTVLDCAKLLHAEIHAAATQTLTVHDKASQDKAKTEIVLGGVRAGEIAAKLKTLPVPSAAERAKLTAEMEAADAAHRKANEESSRRTSPPSLRLTSIHSRTRRTPFMRSREATVRSSQNTSGRIRKSSRQRREAHAFHPPANGSAAPPRRQGMTGEVFAPLRAACSMAPHAHTSPPLSAAADPGFWR
jgi:hypothetical protein